MRSHVKSVLLALATLALVAWFLRQADFAKVWHEIRSARLDALGMTLIMTGATYVLRAYRWQFLLRPIGPTRFREVFRTDRHRVRRQHGAAGAGRRSGEALPAGAS